MFVDLFTGCWQLTTNLKHFLHSLIYTVLGQERRADIHKYTGVQDSDTPKTRGFTLEYLFHS